VDAGVDCSGAFKKKGRFLNRDFAVKHEKLITKTAGNI
jgi:hypothetical protein